jgi:hypothetical protein
LIFVKPPPDAKKSQDTDYRQKLFFVGYMLILSFNSNDKTMSFWTKINKCKVYDELKESSLDLC